jgi:opacity protein-like surface antigen
MKKIALATLLALAAATASAVEIGVVGSSDLKDGSHNTRDGFGLTVGQHFGAFSATAEADRYIKNNTNKYSIIGGYDVTKIGTATLTAKVGATYVDPTGKNGYAGLVGAGVSVPVTSKVSATIDYRYQAGDKNAKWDNGSTVLAGAKYSF